MQMVTRKNSSKRVKSGKKVENAMTRRATGAIKNE
jgi:hypothetical protein